MGIVASDYEQRMKEWRMQQASGMGCSQAPPTSAPFSRSLGNRDFKLPKAIVSNEPAMRTIVLQREHQALAFVCDGITDALTEQKVCDVLQYNLGNEKKGVAEVTQEAYSKGSEQNVTAIAVYL